MQPNAAHPALDVSKLSTEQRVQRLEDATQAVKNAHDDIGRRVDDLEAAQCG